MDGHVLRHSRLDKACTRWVGAKVWNENLSCCYHGYYITTCILVKWVTYFAVWSQRALLANPINIYQQQIPLILPFYCKFRFTLFACIYIITRISHVCPLKLSATYFIRTTKNKIPSLVALFPLHERIMTSFLPSQSK